MAAHVSDWELSPHIHWADSRRYFTNTVRVVSIEPSAELALYGTNVLSFLENVLAKERREDGVGGEEREGKRGFFFLCK